MAVDESLSASVSRYRDRRAVRADPVTVCAQHTRASVVRAAFALAHEVLVWQALERSSGKSTKGGRKLASYDLDRRAATTLRIWRQKSRAAALARSRSARLLVGWRRRRQVAHKFGWWAMQIGRRADLRERLATLLCRRVRSTLAAALQQWQHGAAASRHVKESELQRWREWAHVESYQRRRVSSGVRHLLHRMRTRYLRASFEVWYARGERNRRLEGLLTLSLGARQPVDLQRDAFRDWRCSVRWTCCSAWREDPTVRRQRVAFELAAERLRGRLGKRSLSKVLVSWREIARHKERVSVLLQNAMARWNIGSIRGAFAVWKRLLDRREKEDRLSAMQRLAVANMNFRAMMNLGDCFRRWHRTVARRRRCRRVVSKCLLRMQHSLLSYALDGWCVHVHSKKERKRRGARVVARMLNMHVSGAFVQWRDTTKLVRTRRDIGQRAVKILQNNFVYTALSVWHDVVTQQKARRDVVERAVRRLRDNFLFASLNSWCDVVKRQKTLRIIGQRATKRLKNSSLFAVLDIWRKTARSAQRRRVVGSKAVAKMRQALLASALFAWQQYASDHKASAAIAFRAISKLQHNTLAAALHGLRDIVRRLKSHRKVCTRALKRLFHVMLSSAFWGWQQSTAEKRSKWTIIQRAVQRLTQRLAASAFNSWMRSAYQQRKLRRSVRTIIMRLANKTLADALSAWLHSIEMHRRNRTVGERIVQHLQHRGTARAFESWWVTTVETRKHRGLCRLVLNRVYRRCTVMAFEHWAEIVAAKASKAAENARQAAEQARAKSMVDATVLDSVVKEYDAAKVEWEQRWEEMTGELTETKNAVRTLRQQLEQTRARSTVAIKQASMRRAEEVAAEQAKYERALEIERQKNSQLADTIMALRAEMDRMTSESATHVYIQSVCEDTLVQLMDGNERLRREKLALESTLLPERVSLGQRQKGVTTASTSTAAADPSSKHTVQTRPVAASDDVRS